MADHFSAVARNALCLVLACHTIISSNTCRADVIPVVITYSGLEQGMSCAKLDKASFSNMPTIETASEAVISRTDQVLKNLGTSPWSVTKFADNLLSPLGKVKGPTCADKTCGASPCLKATYKLTLFAVPPTTTIIIIPHFTPVQGKPPVQKESELVVPLPFLDNVPKPVSQLYKAEAQVPASLSDKQIRKLQFLAGEIATMAYLTKVSPSEVATLEMIKNLEDQVAAKYGLDLFDRIRVKVVRNASIELDNFPLIDDKIKIHLTNWHDRIDSLKETHEDDKAAEYEEKTQKRELEITSTFNKLLPKSAIVNSAEISGAQDVYEKKSKTRFTNNRLEGQGLENSLVLEATEPIRYYEVTSSAGLSYSTEKNLQGTLALDLNNLLDIGDILTASGAWGTEAGNGKLTWQGTASNSKDERYSGGFNLSGTYDFDKRSPLGQLSTEQIRQETWDAESTLSFLFDSFLPDDHSKFEGQDANRKMLRFWISYSFGMDFKKFTANVSTPAINADTNSIVNGVTVGATKDLHYDDSSPFSNATGILRLKLEDGIKVLIGDKNYTKFSGTLTSETYFGGSKDSRDYVLRIIGKGGNTSTNTPYSALFQLGGSDGVRGLETTELTGASFWGTTEELGVRLSKFFPKQTNQGKDAAINLNKLYLKVFHDWVHSEGSKIPSFPSLDKRATANGYGIALEISNILVGKNLGAFAFGYAISPNSNLNRHGTVNAEFRTDF